MGEIWGRYGGDMRRSSASRVGHLIADRQQQHAPLVGQSAQHLAPKGVEERDVSAIRHSPAACAPLDTSRGAVHGYSAPRHSPAGEWVGGVRGDEEEGESGGGCGAAGREPGGEGGHLFTPTAV